MQSKKLGSIALALTLAACATTAPEVNLNLLPAEPMLDVNNMPNAQELDGRPLNVLTMASKTDNVLINKYKLNEQLPGKIEKVVMSGGALTVERSLATKLIEEIELSEESGNYGAYQGPNVSDLVMVAKLTNAAFSKDFRESYTYKNKKGETVRVPAKCSFKAQVEGFVKILSLPNMQLVETVPFSETESNSTDTRNSNCPISEQNISHMLNTAMTDSFNGGSTLTKIKSAVAAKAYIVGKKSDGKTTFFKTTLKKSLGAVEGQTVRLYMTDENSGELLFIGDGTITSREYITDKYSYIYLNDKKIEPMIRKGMVVKIFEDCGFGCQMSDMANSVNSAL